MSFSSKIKEEILNSYNNEKNNCCIIAERFGENLTSAIYKSDLRDDFEEYFNISKLKECCIKSILKGVFLSTGYIADPKQDYHFEILFKNKACAYFIFDLLSVLNFSPKILKRKQSNLYVIYIKEADQISYFLSVIGASEAVLYLEEIRVEKDVKNNINRTTNCQTANIAKTIKSSVNQINAINKIINKGQFDKLNSKLKYTANLRLKYPNESLDYISNITKKNNIKEEYISKSGLKHRLDKIIEFSNNI